MRRSQKIERGFSLLVAMMVVVLLTLLVVGAIAFTGSERSAAVLHTRAERLTGCTQAARDLFLGRVRALSGGVPTSALDAGVALGDMLVATNHYSNDGTAITVQRLQDNTMSSAGNNARDISNTVDQGGILAGYYRINAICYEHADGGGASQEVEFVVRVGL